MNRNSGKMEKKLIELIKPVELVKEGCMPIIYEKETILKVIMRSGSVLIVTADSKFNFTLPLEQKNIVWTFF